jgi:flagellar brake protein
MTDLSAVARSLALDPNLTDDDDLHPFAVNNRAEVIGILRELGGAGAPLTLNLADRRTFVTSILSVNPEFGELVLDAPQDTATLRASLASSQNLAEGLHDQVRVEFALGRLSNTLFDGLAALRTPIPETIIRLQRRNDYRARVPVREPSICHIPQAGGLSVAVRVIDISCGGLAFVAPQSAIDPKSGDEFSHVHVNLPNIGEVLVTFVVRHVARYRDGFGKAMVRCGVQFKSQQRLTDTLVQRYIHVVDSARREGLSLTKSLKRLG